MDEPTQEDEPSGDQHPETPLELPGDQPPARGGRKFRLTWQFVAGFFGWYLVMALINGPQVLPNPGAQVYSESLFVCNALLFPVQVLLLIIWIKARYQVGWGMLAAIGVNLVISLALGLGYNAACFIPFFVPTY